MGRPDPVKKIVLPRGCDGIQVTPKLLQRQIWSPRITFKTNFKTASNRVGLSGVFDLNYRSNNKQKKHSDTKIRFVEKNFEMSFSVKGSQKGQFETNWLALLNSEED